MKKTVSKVRKVYIARLAGRCGILIASVLLWILAGEEFEVLEGMNFFKKFSVFHLLWGIWLLDMYSQLVPVKGYMALGSQKHFRVRFRPIKEKINAEALKKHIASVTKSAYKVIVIWIAFIALIAVLYYQGILDKSMMFLITIIFYVCDLICVLVWCPFRLLMKNRCCTTCRIFNWDHLMMFSPMLFVGGFYAESLFILSLIVWIVWEVCVLLHPERFWEKTNIALRCSECTDKLCTQYCQKLRK